MIQVTYQKRDGSIIQRLRRTMIPYKIGEETSMGWIVLNIEYEHNGKYYSEYQRDKLINQDRVLFKKSQQRREFLIKEIKKFLYYFIAVAIIKLIQILLCV